MWVNRFVRVFNFSGSSGIFPEITYIHSQPDSSIVHKMSACSVSVHFMLTKISCLMTNHIPVLPFISAPGLLSRPRQPSFFYRTLCVAYSGYSSLGE